MSVSCNPFVSSFPSLSDLGEIVDFLLPVSFFALFRSICLMKPGTVHTVGAQLAGGIPCQLGRLLLIIAAHLAPPFLFEAGIHASHGEIVGLL